MKNTSTVQKLNVSMNEPPLEEEDLDRQMLPNNKKLHVQKFLDSPSENRSMGVSSFDSDFEDRNLNTPSRNEFEKYEIDSSVRNSINSNRMKTLPEWRPEKYSKVNN